MTRNWGASLTPGWSRKRRLSHCSLDQSSGQYRQLQAHVLYGAPQRSSPAAQRREELKT